MAEGDVKFGGLNYTLEDRRKTKDFKGKMGTFTFQYPLLSERSSIAASISRALDGRAVDSYLPADYENIRMGIYLNGVIVESPPWWDGVEKCPSYEFIIELWRYYLDFEQEFEAKLKREAKSQSLGKA